MGRSTKLKGWIFVFILFPLGIPACRFHSAEPLSPGVGPGAPAGKVRNLQPTLRWDGGEPNSSYDVIIYESVQVEDGGGGNGADREELRTAYYREGLRGTEHTVEEPLKPGAKYYWTVRARYNQQVSDWSRYDASPLLPGIAIWP